jgi:hypothetical protein
MVADDEYGEAGSRLATMLHQLRRGILLGDDVSARL